MHRFFAAFAAVCMIGMMPIAALSAPEPVPITDEAFGLPTDIDTITAPTVPAYSHIDPGRTLTVALFYLLDADIDTITAPAVPAYSHIDPGRP